VIFVGEALRGGSTQNVDSYQLTTTLYRKSIFTGGNIQRRRIELIGEIRVFLVVRLAIDVNFVEIVERRTNARKPETDLQQNEEQQRNQDCGD